MLLLLRSSCALAVSFLFSLSAYASETIANPLTNTGTLEGLITTFLQAIVQIGAVFLVLALVWVGFLFASAQGNEEKLKTARNALFWSVIAGLVLLGAQTIAEVIKNTAVAL